MTARHFVLWVEGERPHVATRNAYRRGKASWRYDEALSVPAELVMAPWVGGLANPHQRPVPGLRRRADLRGGCMVGRARLHRRRARRAAGMIRTPGTTRPSLLGAWLVGARAPLSYSSERTFSTGGDGRGTH